MDTYDPTDAIVHRHMPRDLDPYAAPLASGRTNRRLPAGYAHKSLKTRVQGASW